VFFLLFVSSSLSCFKNTFTDYFQEMRGEGVGGGAQRIFEIQKEFQRFHVFFTSSIQSFAIFECVEVKCLFF
jgi:hypothetical protein